MQRVKVHISTANQCSICKTIHFHLVILMENKPFLSPITFNSTDLFIFPSSVHFKMHLQENCVPKKGTVSTCQHYKRWKWVPQSVITETSTIAHFHYVTKYHLVINIQNTGVWNQHVSPHGIQNLFIHNIFATIIKYQLH